MQVGLVDGRNHQLDGLRGYAAIAVSVFHAILAMDESLVPRIVYGDVRKLPDTYSWFAKITLKLFSGETAVFIFFVLSGIVLFQSLMRSRRSFLSEAVSFSIRRLLRIYPALILNLILMTLCFAAMSRTVSLYDFAVNFTLYAFPVNGATWTLNVEVVAVGFILVTYLGYLVGCEWGLIAVAVAIGIAVHSPLLRSIAVTFKDNWALFVLGMLAPTRIGAWFAQLTPVNAWPFVLLVVIAFKGSIQPVAIALLITMLYYDRAGTLGRLLEKPISRFLGKISYSYYLYSVFVLSIVAHYSTRYPLLLLHPVESGLLMSVPMIAVTIPIAYFSTRFVEAPGIALGRMITNSRVKEEVGTSPPYRV